MVDKRVGKECTGKEVRPSILPSSERGGDAALSRRRRRRRRTEQERGRSRHCHRRRRGAADREQGGKPRGRGRAGRRLAIVGLADLPEPSPSLSGRR